MLLRLASLKVKPAQVLATPIPGPTSYLVSENLSVAYHAEACQQPELVDWPLVRYALRHEMPGSPGDRGRTLRSDGGARGDCPSSPAAFDGVGPPHLRRPDPIRQTDASGAGG